MKRAYTILLICFCLYATDLFSYTITVGPKESVHTIKEGIALAKPGDTLLVKPGTYREGNIILNKSITLIGESFPVLDGENKYEILTIHADGVVINGLKFIDTGVASMDDLAAIRAVECSKLRILNNQFENAFFGIYIANSSHAWIVNNQLHSKEMNDHQTGNGIHMWKCEYITISNNTINGHRDGMYFEFVTNSLITSNYSEGNLRYGLHFMFSHNNEYRNNTFKDNGSGVAVMYTKGVKMIDNTFEHNWGSASYGLLLKEIKDSFVTGNKFIQNSIGILMEGSSRTEFKENTFSKNGYAIKLQASCDDNNFLRNNFSSNTFDMVSNGDLVLNNIDGNYWDRYEGYDLNHDNIGDVPYRPVSMYGMIVEQIPTAVLLWRSFLVFLMDRAEKALPVITPENLKDDSPSMKSHDLSAKHL